MLSIDGRFFLRGVDTFRPIFTSALSILRPDRNDEAVRALLDWIVQTGFNGFRVFAGRLRWANQTVERARARLPFVLDEATSRGLYVEVTAITDSKDGGYEVGAHARAVGDLLTDNAILEVANEPWHPSQADSVHGAGFLAGLGRGVFALGAAQNDESDAMSGGTYVTVHLSRSRDKWNQVRRVSELRALSGNVGKPVLNNEPIGADEVAEAGRRESDPAFFFCMGVLNRLNEIGGVFHSQAGLHAGLPGLQQQRCAEAFVAGSHAIPTADRLHFENADNLDHWPNSPIKTARFGDTVVRAYTGVSGDRAWTVLVGLTGDPGLVLQNGWAVSGTLATMPGVDLLELHR